MTKLQTHHPDCWRDERHHACAVRRVEELTEREHFAAWKKVYDVACDERDAALDDRRSVLNMLDGAVSNVDEARAVARGLCRLARALYEHLNADTDTEELAAIAMKQAAWRALGQLGPVPEWLKYG